MIKGKYDTKRVGTISKSLSIESNAKRPNVVVRLKGLVYPTEEWVEKQKQLQLKNRK